MMPKRKRKAHLRTRKISKVVLLKLTRSNQNQRRNPLFLRDPLSGLLLIDLGLEHLSVRHPHSQELRLHPRSLRQRRWLKLRQSPRLLAPQRQGRQLDLQLVHGRASGHQWVRSLLWELQSVQSPPFELLSERNRLRLDLQWLP
jgi:hypothetical protein